MNLLATNQSNRDTVTVVGCGATGSNLVPHLARRNLHRLTLNDFDRFEPRNLSNQNVIASQIGKPKCQVLAEVAKAISPNLDVRAINSRVEDVPRGKLRASIIVACTDSRASRMTINMLCWRLGAIMIDVAVGLRDHLARVAVFEPGPTGPCTLCTWDDEDFRTLEQTYACNSTSVASQTSASSSLGALAAAIAAAEVEKALARSNLPTLASHQRIIGTGAQEHLITRFQRNSNCRFDHEVWDIERVAVDPQTTSLDDLLGHDTIEIDSDESTFVSIEGVRFAHSLTCLQCQSRESKLMLTRSIKGLGSTCPRCGGELTATALDTSDQLRVGAIHARDRHLPLADIGVLPHDIVSIGTAAGTRHIELIEDHKRLSRKAHGHHSKRGAAK